MRTALTLAAAGLLLASSPALAQSNGQSKPPVKAGVAQSQKGQPQVRAAVLPKKSGATRSSVLVARTGPNKNVMGGGARGGAGKTRHGGSSTSLAGPHAGVGAQPNNNSQPAKARTRGTTVGGAPVQAPG